MLKKLKKNMVTVSKQMDNNREMKSIEKELMNSLHRKIRLVEILKWWQISELGKLIEAI